MIKYLGSKRALLPELSAVFAALPEVRSVLDLFSGTARVGHMAKGLGLRVIANDHNAYAATLARCYVEADAEEVADAAARLIAELNGLPGRAGYFTSTFCEQARYFQPKNGARVDAIRDQIAAWGLPPALEAVLLVSLMEAADRVDSTTGVQMAYLKQWAPRAHNELSLRLPAVLPRAAAGRGLSLQLDAAEAAAHAAVALGALDVAYLDPPYNQHKYLGNYHIWETLVRWDAPEVYGIACKRVDCRSRVSAYNGRGAAAPALRALIEAVPARHLVVSFSDEGYISAEDLAAMLAGRGEVLVLEVDFKRYVGAQIGIHNPKGEKVGKVSHLRNRERIFIATEDAGRVRRALATSTAAGPRLVEDA